MNANVETSPARLGARKHKVLTVKNMVLIALFGAISMVLMLFDFPLPFAPAFIKFDFSDLPAILGTFMMGPVEGTLIVVIKILLKLLVKGTSTAFVGDLANLVYGICYILPAALVYKYKKGKLGAALSLIAGTIVVSIVCVFTNAYVMFPLYSELYGMPMEAIIGMGTAINPRITNIFTMMLFSILPFNLFKYGEVSEITFLVYKRLKGVLFKNQEQ